MPVNHSLDDDCTRSIVDDVKNDVWMYWPGPQSVTQLGALSADARMLGKQVACLLKIVKESAFAGRMTLGVPCGNLHQIVVGRMRPLDRVSLGRQRSALSSGAPIGKAPSALGNVVQDVIGQRAALSGNVLGMAAVKRGHERLAISISSAKQPEALANDLALVGVTTGSGLLGNEVGEVIREVDVHRPHCE